MLRREGADPFVLGIFYNEVVQAMLIFGAETWVLTAEISQKLKGVHVGFLRQVTRKKTQRLGGNSYQKVPVDIALHASGIQPLNTHIDKRQAAVEECVELRPIFELCTK